MLSVEDFEKVDLKVGTILEAKINKRAKKPAYILKVDLGEKLGVKTSSAQLTELYSAEDLIGKQVVVVTNFSPIRIGDAKSEVRVLGADTDKGCVLLTLERKTKNGSKVY